MSRHYCKQGETDSEEDKSLDSKNYKFDISDEEHV